MSDDKGYEVGHGRPPQHSRFTKGVSGNPAGAKSRVDREQQELENTLGRKVRIVRKNKIVSVPFDEVVLRRLISQALQGHLRSIRTLFFDHWLKYGAIPISRAQSVSPIVTLPADMPLALARQLIIDFGPPPWTNDQVDAARQASASAGKEAA